MNRMIAPSILTADLGQLDRIVEMLNESDADWIHLDIMDGVFVPNITFGFQVISTIRKKAKKPLDVHLMIVQPERYIRQFRDAGADILSVHYEACTHLHRVVQQVRDEGMKAGVAVNPHTPVSQLEDILTDLDMVLIMAVNPGFGAQKFIPQATEKVRQLKKMINERNAACMIELDGGVSLSNITRLNQAGVDVLVAGNAVFSAPDPKQAIRELKMI